MVHILKVSKIGFTDEVIISNRKGNISNKTEGTNVKCLDNKAYVYVVAVIIQDNMTLIDEISEKDIIIW